MKSISIVLPKEEAKPVSGIAKRHGITLPTPPYWHAMQVPLPDDLKGKKFAAIYSSQKDEDTISIILIEA